MYKLLLLTILSCSPLLSLAQSKAEMRARIIELADSNIALKEENSKMKDSLRTYRYTDMDVSALQNEIHALNSEINKLISQLQKQQQKQEQANDKTVESSHSNNKPEKQTSSYSGSSSSSRVIHTGPRGGQYYINKNGNKTYVKRK